jgi:hypothetical protein
LSCARGRHHSLVPCFPEDFSLLECPLEYKSLPRTAPNSKTRASAAMAPRAAAAPTTTLFGGAPYQTNTPSQGSIMLYTDSSCYYPLSNNPTPLVYEGCFPMPLNGIKGVSVASLPKCSDYGTPILAVSDLDGCQNSTQGTGANYGVVGKCQHFSTGVDIKSAQFVCFGKGISDPASATTELAPTTTASTASGSSDEHDDDKPEYTCCCFCTVM